MAGRRPKPTQLHRLQGTFHTGKHGRDRANEPIAEGDLFKVPPGLTRAQQLNWRYAIEHAPKHLIKKIDRAMLKIWVVAEDRHDTANRMQAQLDAETTLKLLIRGPLGLMPSPYFDMMDKAAKTMFRAATELGFSPAARPRLQVEPPDEGEDETSPWAMLRVLPGGKAD
jgi:P27 family predicted phage terminase small subunit